MLPGPADGRSVRAPGVHRTQRPLSIDQGNAALVGGSSTGNARMNSGATFCIEPGRSAYLLDDLAADDQADVACMRGWRRELFGEKALALKHGRLALAVDKGKVVTVEKD